MTGVKVLLMMGCPEVPIQTSIALYLSHKLTQSGFDVTVAGTNAATKLLKISDSDGYYAKKLVARGHIVDFIRVFLNILSCFFEAYPVQEDCIFHLFNTTHLAISPIILSSLFLSRTGL